MRCVVVGSTSLGFHAWNSCVGLAWLPHVRPRCTSDAFDSLASRTHLRCTMASDAIVQPATHAGSPTRRCHEVCVRLAQTRPKPARMEAQASRDASDAMMHLRCVRFARSATHLRCMMASGAIVQPATHTGSPTRRGHEKCVAGSTSLGFHARDFSSGLAG